MAIGIGMNCMYCDHGPCNGDCDTYEPENVYLDSKDEIEEVFKWLDKKNYLSDNWVLLFHEYTKEKKI